MLEKYNIEIENNVYEISRAFAIRVVNLYKYLCDSKKEFVLSKQMYRSGTSIGANVFEGKNAQSRPDFTTKMNIALKEATETAYWLDLLHEAGYLNGAEYDSISNDCNKIIAILTKIVKATKK